MRFHLFSIFLFFIHIFLFVFVLFSTVYPASSQIIRLTTQIWEPYQIREGMEIKGFAIQKIQCIFQKSGYYFRVVFYPWEIAQKRVKQGHAEGFFLARKDLQRDQYAIWVGPLFQQYWTWYWIAKDKPDFKKIKVSSLNGSSMRNFLIKNGYQLPYPSNNMPQLLSQLKKGVIQAILSNKTVITYFNMTLEEGKYEVIKKQPLGIYFHKEFVRKSKIDNVVRKYMDEC